MLWKHKEIHHPTKEPKYQFKAKKFLTTPMEKSIYEGVSINNSPSNPGHFKSSKTEYKQGKVARVVLARGLGQSPARGWGGEGEKEGECEGGGED